MKRQLAMEILRETVIAYAAIVDTEAINIARKLNSAPTELSIEMEEIAKYFTSSEVEVISKAWEAYDYYRRNYYKSSYYSGDEIRIIIDKADPVINALTNWKIY